MGDSDFSGAVDNAMTSVGKLGTKAGNAVKELADRETVERIIEGVKTGARTAAGGIAKGAKIAADGIAKGTKEASDIICTDPDEYGNGGKGNIRVFRLKNGTAIPAVGFGTYLATEKNGKQTILDALEAGYRCLLY